MGKTLAEMFLTEKSVRTGETAAVTYEIQNAKAIPIHSENPLLQPAFAAVSALRKSVNKKYPLTETMLEETVSGLAPLFLASEPVLYGTSIVKINTHTTPAVVSMKLSANGVSTPGLLSGVVSSLANATNKIATTLGTKEYSPTDLMNDAKFTTVAGNTVSTVNYLNTLRGGPGALGSILGGALKGGTAGQMGSSVIGGAINTGVSALRKGLFGSTESGLNGITQTTPYFSSNNTYHSYMRLYDGSPLQDLLTNEALLPPKTDISEGSTGFVSNASGKLQGYSTIPSIALLDVKSEPNTKLLMYSKKVSRKTASGPYDKNADYNAKLSRVFTIDTDSDIPDDFVILAFKTLATPMRSIRFPATVTGLSENISPSWDSAKFVGSPFNYYTYIGVERSVNFNFKVYSNNPTEHKRMWTRLQALTHMTYPQGYVGLSAAVIPPFISFTLGSLYKNKPAIIDSLSYTQMDEMGWEIGQSTESTADTTNVKNWILPKAIDVSITVKLLETKHNTQFGSGFADHELYPFGDLASTPVTKETQLPGSTAAIKAESAKVFKKDTTFGVDSNARATEVNAYSDIKLTPLEMTYTAGK